MTGEVLHRLDAIASRLGAQRAGAVVVEDASVALTGAQFHPCKARLRLSWGLQTLAKRRPTPDDPGAVRRDGGSVMDGGLA